MSAACGVPWCVEDPGAPFDDFDGRGSRMHRGEITFYQLPDDETNTYSRDEIEAYVARWDDVSGVAGLRGAGGAARGR